MSNRVIMMLENAHQNPLFEAETNRLLYPRNVDRGSTDLVLDVTDHLLSNSSTGRQGSQPGTGTLRIMQLLVKL